MDDQRNHRESGEGLTPRSLLAVVLAYLGISYVCGGAMLILGMATGPFASTIVGIILLFIAVQVYRGGTGK
jgi:uncharacterized membrane protein YphA (DoxX/SURF4 family)